MKKILQLFISNNKLKLKREDELRKKYSIPSNVILSGSLKISGDFKCEDGCKFLHEVWVSGETKIGRYTTINGPNTDIISKLHPVTIGSFTSIARNVSIQEYNHHFDRPSTYFMNKNIFDGKMADDIQSKGPVVIGNDVWIGSHSIILSGVNIGDGAIIAANSVVNADVPPYAIVGGSPARVVRYRFSEEKINELIELSWWNWDLQKLKENEVFFNNRFE